MRQNNLNFNKRTIMLSFFFLIGKKSKNEYVFTFRVWNDQVRYEQARNDRGLGLIGSPLGY